jgi:hypothetical protein
MILLERGNRILGETVASKFFIDPEEKVEAFDVKLCDFDDSSYRVTIDAESKNIMTVSLGTPCYKDIADVGAREAVDKRYGKMAEAKAVANYDVTLKINLDDLKDQKQKGTGRPLTAAAAAAAANTNHHTRAAGSAAASATRD